MKSSFGAQAVKGAASCCFLGYLPVAPGTMGAVLGLVTVWYAEVWGAILAVVLTAIGYSLCGPAQKAFGSEDPKAFVLDEAAGMAVSLLALPHTGAVAFTAFVIFRVLDIFKPWPIRECEKTGGAFAIMHDDLAAGLITNFILRILLWIR